MFCASRIQYYIILTTINAYISFLTFAFASIFDENLIWFTLFCQVAFYKETIYVYLISYLIIIIKVGIQLLYLYLDYYYYYYYCNVLCFKNTILYNTYCNQCLHILSYIRISSIFDENLIWFTLFCQVAYKETQLFNNNYKSNASNTILYNTYAINAYISFLKHLQYL